MFKKILVSLVLVGVAVALYGCGEAAKDFGKYTIRGTLWAYDFTKSYNQDYLKYYTITVPGAVVTLTTPGGNYAGTTDTNGVFSIPDVPLGNYTIVVTKEGYMRYVSSYTINAAEKPAGSTIDLIMSMDPRPYVTNVVATGAGEITVESIVPTSVTSFQITFNKPMDTSTVYPFIKENSLRTSGLSAQGVMVNVTSSWDSTKKILTVNVPTALTADSNYHLGLTCLNGNSYNYMRDTQGNYFYYGSTYSLFNSPYTGYDYSLSTSGVGYVYVPFKTVTNKTAVPGKVNNLRALKSFSNTSQIDYADLYYRYLGVGLSWDATAEANGYRILAAYNGGLYQLVKSSATPSVLVEAGEVDDALADLNGIGGESYPCDPGTPWPFLGSGVSLEVIAFNTLGEGVASDSILVKDNVAPTFGNVTETSNTEKLFRFSEPLDRVSAQDVANYAIPAQTIVSATLVNDYNDPTSTYVKLILTPGVANDTLTVNNLKDLSGNTITAGSTKTF
jgi:hypothetical protein